MGEPEMLAMWNDLLLRGRKKELSAHEILFFDKWSKSVEVLSANPRHPGLRTHEIDDLSRKFGIKVWQSYLENRKSGALRMFWAYGPGKQQITILAVQHHPESGKRKAYEKIKLSSFPASKTAGKKSVHRQ